MEQARTVRKILFLHGWNSAPGGVKPTYLAGRGHHVFNPALDNDDFDEAVRTAQACFDEHQPDVVVGSSRGGAVAMNIRSGAAQLVLLCPAWKSYGTARSVKPGTVILHSHADDVVPLADSDELARNSGLPPSALVEIGSDHRLADPEPLERMLRECERAAGGDEQVAFQTTIPILRIFDLDKAKEFYADYLGFSVDWLHRFEPDLPAYVQVSRAGLVLHLSEHHGDCCPGATVFVWMTGIDEFHREIASRPYRNLRPSIESTFYDARCLEVVDPFGNRIRFNESAKPTRGALRSPRTAAQG